jgi:hypothetical protein
MRLPNADVRSAVCGFAGLISPTPTGMHALQIKARVEFGALLQRQRIDRPLALAQQHARDFLTAGRASVSVEEYEVL